MNRIIAGTIIVVFGALFVVGITITCLTEARRDLVRIMAVSSIFTLALVGTGTLLIRFGLRAHRLQKALRTIRAGGDPSVDPEEIAKRFRLRPAFLKGAVSEEIRAREGQKRCQEPFLGCFLGLPRGRSVEARPSFSAIRVTQAGAPRGRPRATL